MSISAVILSFNAKEDLQRCVRSLVEVEELRADEDQILIVDNGSTDGSRTLIERLAGTYPDLIDTILLDRNRGTTAPRNLGFAKAKGDYVLVIDSDIQFRSPVLSPLTEQLAADPSIGIIAPRLIFPDGRRQMSTDVFPTIPRKLERLFRLRRLERLDDGRRQPSHVVDYAISAFWLMRRGLIDRIGPLDERIFYAPEDVDFCLRTWLGGKSVVYRQDLDVVHDAQERSRSLKGLLFSWRHILGLAYFFRKHRYAFNRHALYRRIGKPRARQVEGTLLAASKLARELESGVRG